LSAPPLPPPGAPGKNTPLNSKPAPKIRKPNSRGSDRVRASVIPLLLGIGTVTLGSFLLFAASTAAIPSSTLTLGLFGYALSGFATPLLWGWDATSQRRGSNNPNFSGKRQYSSTLRVLALLGIAISIVHLLFVSEVLAERLSEILFVAGWVGA
jgi:hypothetical protein